MRKFIILPLIAVLTACGGHHENDGHHHHSAEVEEHEHDKHDHDHGEAESHAHGKGEIVLHKEVADEFGVEIDTVKCGDFSSTVRAAGVVLTASSADAVVSAPTAGVVRIAPGIEAGRTLSKGALVATIDARNITGGDANASAKAALDAARTEYERIEALYKDRLATIGERNAALAAYNQAKAAYSPAASSGRATSPIAGTVTSLDVRQGQYVEAGAVLATVAADGEQVLRIDLPQRYYSMASTLSDAVVSLPYSDKAVKLSELGGRRLTTAPVAASGAAAAYIPVYFNAGRTPGLVAGTTFTAYLLGSPRSNVVSVPAEALSEQQGDYFVYERLDEECYAKRRVEIGASDGMRVEIRSGVEPGTLIVGKGVTTVRLAETGSNIPEGHSHNH